MAPGEDGNISRQLVDVRGAPAATVTFEAHPLGIITMRLRLPQPPSARSELALYERLSDLSARRYACVLAREDEGRRLEVRSLLGTAPVDGETDDPFPWASTPKSVEHWLRTSLSCARDLLRAYVGAPRRRARS